MAMCRSRTWLFLSYVIAFVSLAGSAGMLVQDALLPDTPSSWTGIAGVLQCTFVLTRYIAIISLFSCVSAAEEIINSSKVCTTGNGQWLQWKKSFQIQVPERSVFSRDWEKGASQVGRQLHSCAWQCSSLEIFSTISPTWNSHED